MNGVLDWASEGRDWPNRAASRFLDAGGVRWHVQVMGDGPELLLLHGTGAATHSWRDLAPLLARTHTVIAPDLPGHGFTSRPEQDSGFALPRVAAAVASLLKALAVAPHVVVGHSAGAAIGVRMALDGGHPPAGLIGLNAALLPFPGPLGRWAPHLAKTLFFNPVTLSLFLRRASRPGAIKDLMRSTGSSLDTRGVDLYARLFRSRSHLEATVALMAHWDLVALKRDLPRLRGPLSLIVAERDRAIPPDSAHVVRRLAPQARIVRVPALGHLAHEESPELLAGLIQEAADRAAR
ncbi:MAG: alpha/beta fold hydrolase [Hyphomonadaceae bacterium]|nr:alpha/beta fold hydrolase [Hyphomonadaceae bacterium]